MLCIQNAKKISDWEVIGSMKNIESLVIHACGNIKNLDFLTKLKKVKRIDITNVKVEDDFNWIFRSDEFREVAIRMPNGRRNII